MRRHVIKVGRWVWYVLAVIIILLAIAASVLHFVIPQIVLKRANFEHWAEKVIGQPISIGHIQARWNGLSPEVDFDQLTIYQKQQKQLPVLQINRLHVALNLWSALFGWRFEPTYIAVDGVKLNVHQLGEGQWLINGLLQDGQPSTGAKANYGAVVHWLETQPQLKLNHVTVDFYNAQKAHRQFVIPQANLVNHGEAHQLIGELLLPKYPKASVDFGIQLTGYATRSGKRKALLYAKLHDVALAPWLTKPIAGYQVEHAFVNGQVWLHWANGRWKESQADLHAKDLKLRSVSLKTEVPLQYLSGHLAWKPLEGGWTFLGDQVRVVINQHRWPKTSFSLEEISATSHQPAEQTLVANYLDLADLSDLLSHTNVLSEKNRTLVKHFGAQGQVENLTLKHQGKLSVLGQDYALQVDLKNFAVLPYEKIPGVSGFSGHINATPKQGSLSFHSPELVLDIPRLFTHSLTLGRSSAAFSWQHDADNSWLVSAKDFFAVNADAAFYANFNVLLPADHSSPVINLLGGFQESHPNKVQQYFPENFFSKKLSQWLNDAFVSGGSGSGALVLRGALKNYPFKHHVGTFIVDADIHRLNFHYAKGWPLLRNLTGNLVFHDGAMAATAHQGTILNTKLLKLHAEIPTFHAKKVLLNLDAQAAGNSSDVLKFLVESPLKALFGKELSTLSLNGPSKTAASLVLPLSDQGGIKVHGYVDMHNNVLKLLQWNLAFKQLSGKLNFNGQGIDAEKLTASFLGHPVTAEISTKDDADKKALTQIKLQGYLNAHNVNQLFPLPVVSLFNGGSAYDVNLKLHTSKQDKRQNQLVLHSNLKGLAINIPAPLGKRAEEVLPTTAVFNFGGELPVSILVDYADRVSSAYLLTTVGGDTQLFSADVHIGGPGAKIQKEPGMIVTGYLKQFSWKVWQPFFQELTAHTSGQEKSAFYPRSIDLSVGQLNVMQQVFKNINLKILPSAKFYNISMYGKQVVGELNLPKVLTAKSLIKGQFQKLYIQPSALINKGLQHSKGAKLLDPGTLPKVYLAVDDFQYANKPFGGFVLQTIPHHNRLELKQFLLRSPMLSGTMQGNWRLLNGHYETTLTGYVNTNQLEGLLKAWHFSGVLKGTTANSRFTLLWPGSPAEFSLDKVDGTATLNLGSGSILSVNSSTDSSLALGKFLSLFSFQQIFSGFGDLKNTGYTFDSVHSEAQFQHGLMVLQNTYFNGAVARVDVHGDVNLLKKSLDLALYITPHVTSSLPIVAGVATLNPIVGVATWVANKLFSPALNHITSRAYRVTGNWNKPKLVPLSAKVARAASENAVIPVRH